MKKSLRIICLGFVFLFLCAGIGLMYRFPVDTQPFIEKKYAGWNGVLQAWFYSNWSPGGSLIQWLNRCASDFEKEHEGVYLEFTPVSLDAMEKMETSGIRLPDLVFFSPGVIISPDTLMNLQPSNLVRSDLQGYIQGKALPVALSGYIWAYNPALCPDVPRTAADFSVPVIPEDTSGHCYSAALLSLLSGTPNANDTDNLISDPGVDLGLPASTVDKSLFSIDALDLFIDEEIACTPVDARDIALLGRMAESSKGPDWKTAASGDIVCTDQVLLAAVPNQKEKSARSMLAQEFIGHLLEADPQAALADVGAFSVTGKSIHAGFSVYAELDALLNSRPLWLPACFSEYCVANTEAIVRRFLKGELSAKNALCLLGFEGL